MPGTGARASIEDYTTQIRGEPFGAIGVVKRNAAGQTEHIIINQRPRSTLLLVSRLLAAKFAGTPLAGYFLAGAA